MTSLLKNAYIGADIFDGEVLHHDSALLVETGRVRDICRIAEIPPGFTPTRKSGGTIMPGFVDLQVNGGGGVLFNEATSPEGVQRIARAHAQSGTRAILPTLITDTPERAKSAIDAVTRAISAKIPGVVGIHLEGPHISHARKGAHDPALIRKMDRSDETRLIAAAQTLPNVMVTLAPEAVSTEQIVRLSQAGVIVSLGHSDCSFEAAQAAFDAGATCVTHLFNAMSQMGSRAPGLVGAVLDTGPVSAGLIADGIHVHPATLRRALHAKSGPGEIFLVTDAMAPVGSDIQNFTLNNRRVERRDRALRLEDGTLAGADLTMPRALQVLVDEVGLARDKAFRMATSAPARRLRRPLGHGTLLGAATEAVICLRDDFSGADPLDERL